MKRNRKEWGMTKPSIKPKKGIAYNVDPGLSQSSNEKRQDGTVNETNQHERKSENVNEIAVGQRTIHPDKVER